MIERQMELKRRYTRKDKMRKLKKKLGAATGEAREKILYKIKRLSPAWTEASPDAGPDDDGDRETKGSEGAAEEAGRRTEGQARRKGVTSMYSSRSAR